jgi:hypothetical protein
LIVYKILLVEMDKTAFLILFLIASFIGAEAQRLPGLDLSPMDVALYQTSRSGPVIAKIYYSRPYANERKVWGGLIPDGKVWRTGANEAPEITFFQDVDFGGEEIKAGTYSLFTLFNANEVTFILNEGLNQWGAYEYSEEKDIIRVPATVFEKTTDHVENFTVTFDNQDDGSTHLVIAWSDKQARLVIK